VGLYARRTPRARDSGPWTQTMSKGDVWTNRSAIAPPEMLLPMSLQLS
jgi:hypothetical protein